MKMIRSLFLGALAGLAFIATAYAAQTTPTPRAGSETGEDSALQQSIVNVARLKIGFGTGTCSSNAVTINAASGVITTESLSTSAGNTQAITLTSNKIQAGDVVLAMVDPASSAGTPTIANVAVTDGQAVFLVKNIDGSAALNAAIKIMFAVVTKGNPN